MIYDYRFLILESVPIHKSLPAGRLNPESKILFQVC